MIGRWENAFSGKQMDNVRKEAHVVSVVNWSLETVTDLRGEQDNRLLPHHTRRPRLTAREKSSKESGDRDETSFRQKEQNSVPMEKIVIIRGVAIGILPYVKTTSLRLGANLATSAIFDMIHLGCVSNDSYPRESILREEGTSGSNQTVKFSRSP